MGRVEAWEDDEPYPNAGYLFERSVENALRGKKGQALLLEMETALLALPEKKLVGSVIVEDGVGCSLAAVEIQRLMKKGLSRTKACVLLELASNHLGQDRPDFVEQEDLMYQFLKKILNIKAGCLSWQIVYENDRKREITQEQRYDRMLAWIRSYLSPKEA